MFNISLLQTGLAGLIGARSQYDSSSIVPTLDAALTASSSGQYWDDFHPALSTDLLFHCSPNFESEGYAAWAAGTTYIVGSRVVSGNIAYQSKAINNLNHVPPNGTWWSPMFSVWMQERINASIAKLFHTVAVNKKLNLSTKSILEDVQLFTGPGRTAETIQKSGRMVGLRISPKQINNISVVLKYVGLQFSVAGTFTLYLYHSSRQDAVATISVTTTTNNKFEWKLLTSAFTLDYVNFTNNIDAGGDWYLAYFEDDLPGYAVNKSYDFEDGPCSGCPGSRLERVRYNLWNKYVEIMPFTFEAADLNGIKLPDIDKMGYAYGTNYGLNLSLNVIPDVTALILQNTAPLVYPLGLQFVNDMIEYTMFNPSVRVNAPQINAAKSGLDYSLNSETGIKVELNKAIAALAEDFSKLSVVLADNKPSKVSYGSI